MLHAIYTRVNAAILMACTVHCPILLSTLILPVTTDAKPVFKIYQTTKQTGPRRILFFLSLVLYFLFGFFLGFCIQNYKLKNYQR